MGLFGHKKNDPISERARALNAEIAALEAQIKELDTRVRQPESQPRLRSTARPAGHIVPAASPSPREPVFEQVDHHRVKAQPEPQATSAHFNDLGVRKYDLAGAWRRLRNHFHGPPANNPRLVNYLAAGSIQGLRPMRYERRVARNRVIALTIFLLIALWIIIAVFWRR
jgi:hypothetical protein